MSGGFLGFDPDRLQQLRWALVLASNELDAIRCGDVDARRHMLIVESARNVLRDHWIALIDSILGCRALTGYERVDDLGRVDGVESLASSRVMMTAAERGWAVFTDPQSPLPEPMTAARAESVGWLISHLDPDDNWSATELVALNHVLAAIVASPSWTAAFVTSLSPAAWTMLCDQLGDERRRLVSDAYEVDATVTAREASSWAPIDTAFALLGSFASAGGTDVDAFIGDAHPYGVALVVSHLGLDAHELARVSREIIERERIALSGEEATFAGERAADIVMRSMLEVDGAPAEFAVLVADDPSLALWTASGAALTNEFVRTAVDPRWMSEDGAARALAPITSFLVDNAEVGLYPRDNPQVAMLAADVMAAWLTRFPETRAWPIDFRDGDQAELVAIIRGMDAASARLSEAVTTTTQDRLAIVANGAHDATWRSALDDVAALGSFFQTIERGHGIESARDAEAMRAITWGALDALAGVAPTGPVLGWVTGVAVTAAQVASEQFGWFDTVDDVRRDTLITFDTATALVAAAMVATRFAHLVGGGRLDPDTKRPPMPDPDADHVGADYSARFEAWLTDNVADDDIAGQLNEIKQTMLSDHDAEETAGLIALDIS